MLKPGFMRAHSSELDILCQGFDTILVVICLYLAALINDFPWNPHFNIIAIVSVVAFNLFAKNNDLYLSWRTASIWTECKKIVKSWVFTILVAIALALLINLTGEYFRRVILSWFLVGLLFLLTWRISLRIMLRFLRKKRRNIKYVAIAGAGDLGIRVANSILNNPWTGLEICGLYDDSKPKGSIIRSGINLPVKGNLEDLVKTAELGQIDTVYVALPLRAEEKIIYLANKLADTTAAVYIVPSLLMSDFLKAKILELEGIPIVNIIEDPLLGKNNWIKRYQHVIKRIFDVTVASVVLILLAPLLLFISFLILILEGLPITYRSPRYISVNKKIYTLKFRSMVRNATDQKYKLKERFMRDGYLDIPLDCEVYTSIGRLLEKTQLVEILQLFNVIFNEMSLIGNRPLPFDNLGILKRHQGWDRRFDSPAGLTGITQVIGKLNLNAQKRMELECLYSEVYQRGNILKCDLLIIYYTIRSILFNKQTSIVDAQELLTNCLEGTSLLCANIK